MRPIIFGEVLFDVFPDAEVLGGACFNVAWNLRGLGLDPLLITRVGDDERGAQVRDAMARWGMDLSALQVDADHQTGVVQVQLDDGQPSYEIVADQAYDWIDSAASRESVSGQEDALLYHGTLAIRAQASRDALSNLRADFPVFVDLNLRAPWWSQERVEDCLTAARWAKLNDEEVAAVFGVPTLEEHELETKSQELRERFDLDQLIVTMGERGALVVRSGECLDCTPPPIEEIADTVGAGDAFTAVMILGMVRNWSEPLRLRRAVEFAGSVCRRRGAVSELPADYTIFVDRWAAQDATDGSNSGP